MWLDKQLIQRIQARDKKAFAQLYEQTADQLYRFVAWRYSLRKPEINDIIGDFYLKLRRVIDKYDDSYKFESFFRTVFRNMLKDYFKKSSEKHDSIIVDERVSTDPDAMLKRIQWNYQMDSIKKAMGELDELSYQVIIWRYVDQLSYDEISSLCNLQSQAVRKRLSRALLKIKDLLS